MPAIAHLINPVQAGPESDLRLAQPITFETMRRARDRVVAADLPVTLLTAQFPEDRGMVPPGFTATPDLTRSSADLGVFRVRRKLPFFADLIQRLFEGSPAEILIYTNVDIALQPHFYQEVARLWEDGARALVINRRTVMATREQARDLDWLLAQPGEPHRGYDCFVFDRRLLSGFDFHRLLIGAAGFGRTVVAVLSSLDPGFRLVTDARLTFHLNDEMIWRNDALLDYWAFNLAEGRRILDNLRLRLGALSPLAEELYQKTPPRLANVPPFG